MASDCETSFLVTSDPVVLKKLALIEKICSFLIILIGSIVLLGWLIPIVGMSLPTGWDLMKANTALCCVLSAIGFMSLSTQAPQYKHWGGRCCGALVTLMASSALVAHLTGTTFGVETFLAADSEAEMPGRMSIQTATCFLILGFTMLIEGTCSAYWGLILDILSAGLVLMILVITAGYCFGAVSLFGQSLYTRTSPHTLLCLAMLALIVSVRRCVSGYFSSFIGSGTGSKIARNEIAYALAVPFLVVVVIASLEHNEYLTIEYSHALTASVIAFAFFIFIALKATKINGLETELRNNLQFLRIMMNAIPDAVFYCDGDRIMKGYNKAFSDQILNLPPDEIIGKHIHDLPQQVLVDYCTSQESGPLTQQATSPFVRSVNCLDGVTRDFLFSMAPFERGSGTTRGMLVVMRDVTALKRAEEDRLFFQERLYNSQKMEALGSMVGGLAHDFNNMLQIITGYSEVLAGYMKEGQRGSREAQAILATASGGTELLRKLLVFNQQAKADLVTMNLNQQLREFIPLFAKTLPQSVEIDFNFVDKPTIIRADAGQLNQVIINLLKNASEAMPDGGLLKVVTAVLTLDDDYCRKHAGTKPGKYVMLSVTDTGRGIDAETIPLIFDPFFSTKQRGSTRGTGLGLSVVKGIVQQHKGHITCESKTGKGTTFKLFFPAIETTLIQSENSGPLSKPSGNETLLLVVNAESQTSQEERILGSAGYNVIVANSGKEAIEILEARLEDISIVVLEISLSDIEAKNCLMGMVRIDPMIKVLVMTDYSTPDELKKSVEPFVAGFLTKPAKAGELTQKVQKIISND